MTMTTTGILFFSLIVLSIINILVTLKKDINVDVKPQLNDFEDRIKSELQRNRTELNDTSERNRKELSESIRVFESKLTESSEKTNSLLEKNLISKMRVNKISITR